MKILARIWLLTFLGFVVMADVQADTISLVSDAYPPYNVVPGSAAPGYVVEIAQRIFEKAGHTVVYEVVPWVRAIDETRDGKHTAIIAALMSDAPDFVFPENEIGVAKYCFYTRLNDPWKYEGVASLAGKKIGAINGYSYTSQLDAFLLNNAQVEQVSGGDAVGKSLEKLRAGRIDAFLENAAVVASFEQSAAKAWMVREAGCQVEEIGKLFIAFGPGDPKAAAYARILSDGIADLRASGELQQILAKYGLTDWK